MLPERNILLSTSDEELTAFCKISFVKGTGPGGQKRNKTSSAVQIELSELDICVQDCTERSQHSNRSRALDKLRRRIAFEVRCLPAELPPRIECSVTHEEYPLNLACLLDVLEENDYDHKAAAAACQVTSSAFVKLLRRDEELWTKVNAARELRGLYKLKNS
jgi:hypothetical protein